MMRTPTSKSRVQACGKHERFDVYEEALQAYDHMIRMYHGYTNKYDGIEVFLCSVWETGRHWHIGRKRT